MPVGVVVDALAVALGGWFGAQLGPRVSEDFKENLNTIFGLCSMAMGIGSIVLMENLPAVIFSVIIGTVVGLLLKLGKRLEAVGEKLRSKVPGNQGAADRDQYVSGLVTAVVLFCASGTGIYGAIVSGISSDHSILLAKSVLDYFTAMIFACSLGKTVSYIAVPQFIIFLLLYLLSGIIMPLTTPTLISDFKACGGIIMLGTGLRIARIKMAPITDMLPAMVFVMPISFLWMTYVLPLL